MSSPNSQTNWASCSQLMSAGCCVFRPNEKFDRTATSELRHVFIRSPVHSRVRWVSASRRTFSKRVPSEEMIVRMRCAAVVLRTATRRTPTVMAWRASSTLTIKALRRFSSMGPPTSLPSSITWRGMSASSHHCGVCESQRAQPWRRRAALSGLWGERSGPYSPAYLMRWDWEGNQQASYWSTT